MSLKLEQWSRTWPLSEPFVTSNAVDVDVPTVQVRLTDGDGVWGRGEAVGVPYAGETPVTMGAQIERVRSDVERGISRNDLLQLLPAGGARHAVDAALWDLEAKRDGVSPFACAGVLAAPVDSDCTIGIRSLADYERTARRLSGYRTLKVKVGGGEAVAAVAAVRRGAPSARLIVDPNQAWTVDQVKAWSPRLAELGTVLLEQPVPVGAEGGLDGWTGPVPLAADELVDDVADLDKAAGRFQVINIKLDKAGGLTAALRLADAAEQRGFGLMVGCMNGSSLSMAPAMVLAQRCRFVDLDGPLAQSEDWDCAFVYRDGRVAEPHQPQLWG
ncbi:enolase C-terminal domain-like protein [uncultured Sphingomonas sp.]|uniref:enolase C-terminal domain-like protein n=1 Tax=uncultured Sphingomonas sp. TaxID=158754 RepID=UPI0035CABAE2